MIGYTFYNGVFSPYEKTALPLSDRSIYFGDGIYEVMLGLGNEPFQYKEHLSRFFKNAEVVGISHSLTEKEFLEIIAKLRLLSAADGYFTVYMHLTRHMDERRHACSNGKSNLLICTLPYTRTKDDGISLITVPDVRYSLCNVKTLNLLPNVLAANKAQERGADEAVFVKDGFVTEGSRSNVFILKDGKLTTHPADCRILPGIMRQNLIAAASDCGITVYEQPFTLAQLYDADEILLTSTTTMLRRCRRVDERDIKCTDGNLIHTLSELISSHFNLFRP